MEPRSPAGCMGEEGGGEWRRGGRGGDRKGGKRNDSCESESYIPRRETQHCCVNVCVLVRLYVRMAVCDCLYAYW